MPKVCTTSMPAYAHHAAVLRESATGVWTGFPPLEILEAALDHAHSRLARKQKPWAFATDAACGFLLTCARIGWTPLSAREIVTDSGLKIDMLRLAPKSVAALAHRSTEKWLASEAKIGQCRTTIFWEALRGLFQFRVDHEWSAWHATVAIKLASGGLRTQRHARGGATLCEFCQLAPDSWYHRCYECEVFFHHRRQHVSKELETAAGNLRGLPHLQEPFCRGNLPHPRCLFPLGLDSEDAQVHWHHQPEGGLFFPDPELGVFVDGSSFGKLDGCRCAGWAVALTNNFGELQAGAFGAVPILAAPNQTSRDAEDYAVFMASQLCLGPLKVRPDCSGTVSTANGSRALACGPGQARAHLWAKTFADHPELEAIKVKGHATSRDIELGRTTLWEKKGNTAADVLAKKGALKHPSWGFEDAQATIRGLSSLARQSLAWTTKLHIIIQNGIQKRKEKLPPEAGHGRARPPFRRTAARRRARHPGRRRPVAAPEVPGLGDTQLQQHSIDILALDPRRYRGHSLLIADLSDLQNRATGERLLWCQLCKCYYHHAATLLAQPCKGMACRGAGGQTSRLRRGLHPLGKGPYVGWRLVAPRRPLLHEAYRAMYQLEATKTGGRAPLGPAQPKRRRTLSSGATVVAALATARELGVAPEPLQLAPDALSLRRDFFQAFGSTPSAAARIGVSVRRRIRFHQESRTPDEFLCTDSD